MATIHEISSEWQIEGLSPTWVKVHKSVVEYDLAQSRIRALEAERDALAADAARYRWLKERATVSHVLQATPTGFHYPTTWHIVTGGSDTDIDAAIDAAMKGE